MNLTTTLFQFNFDNSSAKTTIDSYSDSSLKVDVIGNCPVVEDDIIGNSLSLPIATGGQTTYENYLTLPSFSTSNPATDLTKGFSVCAWIKFNSFQNYAPILCFGNPSGVGSFAFQLDEETGSFMTNNVDQYGNQYRYVLSASDALQTGKWYHIAASIDAGGNPTFYINGVQKSNTKSILSEGTPSDALTNFLPGKDYLSKAIKIGASNFDFQNAMPLDADLAWLSAYQGALSATQIQEDMSIRSFVPIPKLLEFDFADVKSGEITGSGPNQVVGTLSAAGCTTVNDVLMGNCLQFSGTGNVSFPSVGSASDFSSGVTITSWVKLKDLTTAATIMQLESGTASAPSDSFSLGINATGNLMYSCFNSGAPAAVSVAQKESLTAGEWIHIAVSIDSTGTSTLFVNGSIAEQSESTQPSGLLPSGIMRTINTIGTSLNGAMAWVALYNGCLNISQVNEDLEHSANNRTSTFQKSFPVNFSLYSDYYGSQVPALYLVSENGSTMTLEVSSNSLNPISFPTKISTQPSVGNYHLQLRFKPGILSKDFIKTGIANTAQWNAAIDVIGNGDCVVSFICLDNSLNVAQDSPVDVEIPKVNGDPIGGARNTNVEFLYDLAEQIDPASDNTPAASLPIKGNRLQNLNIVNHIGNSTSPLVVDILGPARILNNNTATNTDSISLRIFNSSETETISFYDEKDQTKTTFQVTIPVEGSENVPNEMAMVGANNVDNIGFEKGNVGVFKNNAYYGTLNIVPGDGDNIIQEGDSFQLVGEGGSATNYQAKFFGSPNPMPGGNIQWLVQIGNGSHYEAMECFISMFKVNGSTQKQTLLVTGNSQETKSATVDLSSPLVYFSQVVLESPAEIALVVGDLVRVSSDPISKAFTVCSSTEKGSNYFNVTPDSYMDAIVSSADDGANFTLNCLHKVTIPNKSIPGVWDIDFATKTLGPGEAMTFQIKGIITPANSIAGLTYVHLLISNLNGYWDQNYNLPIEKSPLVIGDNTVALGTSVNSDALLALSADSDVKNVVQLGEVKSSDASEKALLYINPSNTNQVPINVEGIFKVEGTGDFSFSTPTDVGSFGGGKGVYYESSTYKLKVINLDVTQTFTAQTISVTGGENSPLFSVDGQANILLGNATKPLGNSDYGFSVTIGARGFSASENSGNILLTNVEGNQNGGSGDVVIAFVDQTNYIQFIPNLGFTYNASGSNYHQFNGNVKIGETNLSLIDQNQKPNPKDDNVCLHVTNPASVTYYNQGYAWAAYKAQSQSIGSSDANSNSQVFPQGQSNTVSILADGTVVGAQFMSVSDTRIKHQIQDVDSSEDLHTLTQLEVKNYKHIDVSKHGSGSHKGLIAQEVETIFPQAVKHHKDFVPSIYEFANSVALNPLDKELTVATNDDHGLVVGDILKTVSDKGEVIAKVSKILNDKTFVLENWEEETIRLFVIGKQVNDFRTVDYDQVAMLGVSAVQELNLKVESMGNQIDILTKENEALREEFKKILEQLKLAN